MSASGAQDGGGCAALGRCDGVSPPGPKLVLYTVDGKEVAATSADSSKLILYAVDGKAVDVPLTPSTAAPTPSAAAQPTAVREISSALSRAASAVDSTKCLAGLEHMVTRPASQSPDADLKTEVAFDTEVVKKEPASEAEKKTPQGVVGCAAFRGYAHGCLGSLSATSRAGAPPPMGKLLLYTVDGQAVAAPLTQSTDSPMLVLYTVDGKAVDVPLPSSWMERLVERAAAISPVAAVADCGTKLKTLRSPCFAGLEQIATRPQPAAKAEVPVSTQAPVGMEDAKAKASSNIAEKEPASVAGSAKTASPESVVGCVALRHYTQGCLGRFSLTETSTSRAGAPAPTPKLLLYTADGTAVAEPLTQSMYLPKLIRYTVDGKAVDVPSPSSVSPWARSTASMEQVYERAASSVAGALASTPKSTPCSPWAEYRVASVLDCSTTVKASGSRCFAGLGQMSTRAALRSRDADSKSDAAEQEPASQAEKKTPQGVVGCAAFRGYAQGCFGSFSATSRAGAPPPMGKLLLYTVDGQAVAAPLTQSAYAPKLILYTVDGKAVDAPLPSSASPWARSTASMERLLEGAATGLAAALSSTPGPSSTSPDGKAAAARSEVQGASTCPAPVGKPADAARAPTGVGSQKADKVAAAAAESAAGCAAFLRLVQDCLGKFSAAGSRAGAPPAAPKLILYTVDGKAALAPSTDAPKLVLCTVDGQAVAEAPVTSGTSGMDRLLERAATSLAGALAPAPKPSPESTASPQLAEHMEDAAMAEASTDAEEEDRAAEADTDAPESVSRSTGPAEDAAEPSEPAAVSEAAGVQDGAASADEVSVQEHAAECAMETKDGAASADDAEEPPRDGPEAEVTARTEDAADAEASAEVVAEEATPKGAAEGTPTSTAAEEGTDAARESAIEASDDSMSSDEAGRDGGEEEHAAASDARPKSEEAAGTLEEAAVAEELAAEADIQEDAAPCGAGLAEDVSSPADSNVEAVAEAVAEEAVAEEAVAEEAVAEEVAALADSNGEAAPKSLAHGAGPGEDVVEPPVAAEPMSEPAAIVHEQVAEVATTQEQATVGASGADEAICEQKADELPAARVDAADVQVAAEAGAGEVASVSKDEGLDVDAEASAATTARLAGQVAFAEEVAEQVAEEVAEEVAQEDAGPSPAQGSTESAENNAEDAMDLTGMEIVTTPSGVERKRKRDAVKRVAKRFIGGLSRRLGRA